MWLVVAGEPSGDRTLAAVVRASGARSFGIGGEALAAAGTELLAHVRDLSGIGLFELGARVPAIARALAALVARVRRSPPERAVLCSWSSGNARLGAWLRGRGIPVTWISPPEVWAYRGGRLPRLARAADRFVPTLPFEVALWRSAGADAHYVGHPSLDVPIPERPERLASVAVLPGSRPAEIERLLPRFVTAVRMLAPLDARVVRAPSLPRRSVELLERCGLPLVTVDPRVGASGLLPSFDVALVASGTASLEAAVAGVPPIVAYALHPLTYAIARRLVDVSHVALPNVVLVRSGQSPVFSERLQDAADPAILAADLRRALADRPRLRAATAAVRAALDPGTGRSFAEGAAALVDATVALG